ncbi:DUF6461 domain-containing protein [Streptomyces parvus]|uniref:DUF6461 domain-containing protein n=1 Tax=Streptomyces parvus TaxID=66428 RepID=UPI00343E4F3D
MHDGLAWIADAYPEGFTLILGHGVTPLDLLTGLARTPEPVILPLTCGESEDIQRYVAFPEGSSLDHLDEEALEKAGFLREGVDCITRAGAASGGWSFALQDSTIYSSQTDLTAPLSHVPRLAIYSVDVTASALIVYAENGRVLSAFDPIFPRDNHGADSARLPGPRGGGTGRKEILDYLSSVLEVGIPPAMDWEPLPAIALSSTDTYEQEES